MQKYLLTEPKKTRSGTQGRRRLDNLQSRLEPGAVDVGRDQVNAWDARVNEVVPRRPKSWAPEKEALADLRSQAIVGGQLLTGDKQPEAFLGADARAAR